MWLNIRGGMIVAEAYAKVAYSYVSLHSQIAYVAQAACGYCGGYIAVQYGGGEYVLQSGAAGAIGGVFFVVLALSPTEPYALSWGYTAFAMALPFISSMVGGYVSARKFR